LFVSEPVVDERITQQIINGDEVSEKYNYAEKCCYKFRYKHMKSKDAMISH
jgi:hypothetical protein